MSELHTDEPKQTRNEDEFNRYHFARTIADTIKERKDNGCLVIGIYGAWGEGKTTVLNFIDKELYNTGPDITLIRFNPWRYAHEDALLKGFFETLAMELAGALDKSFLENTAPLKEVIKLLGVRLGIGEGLSTVAEIFAKVSLEDLKIRLSNLLLQYQKRLVIVIDDIDRLEKSEIHAIFRLVKLNADFQRTVYILSFDEKMVSQTLGDKYGADSLSGLNFLEKIIQVPLVLPKAYPDDLAKYAIKLLDKVKDNIQFEMNNFELEEFSKRFYLFLKPRISTPRVAVRYANILNYSIPLLYGEVNIVDLLMVEGIKVFYPSVYQMIKIYPDFFLEGYAHLSNDSQTEKRKRFINKFNKATESLLETHQDAIRELLCHLFPKVKHSFDVSSPSVDNDRTADRQQRVCSPAYFDRYFSFAIHESDLSDREMDTLIQNIDYFDEQKGFTEFKRLTSTVSSEKLVSGLNLKLEAMTWQSGKRLLSFLSRISNEFSKNNTSLSMYSSPFSQATLCISNFLEAHRSEPDRAAFVIQIINASQNFEFGFEVLEWVMMPEKSLPEQFFSNEEQQEIFVHLKNRIASDFKRKSLIETLPNRTTAIFRMWVTCLGQEDLEQYLDALFAKNQKLATTLVKLFTPIYTSESNTKGIYGDFESDNFQSLTSCVNPEVLMQYLEHSFGKDEIESDPEYGVASGKQTDVNIVRQFVRQYRVMQHT